MLKINSNGTLSMYSSGHSLNWLNGWGSAPRPAPPPALRDMSLRLVAEIF